MVVSRFMGAGWPGMDISELCFMSKTCTMRSPCGHLNFNFTGPVGVVKVEDSPSLPDLLQPAKVRLNASVAPMRTRFLFMVVFSVRFENESNRPQVTGEL